MASEWRTVRLGDHINSSLGKMLDKKKNQGTLHPYLGNKNVRWGRFELQELAQMKFQDHEHERYGLKYGDLIVCEGGEPGRCAIWKEETPDMKIQKALHRVRAYRGLTNEFLYYWFCYAAKVELLDPYFTGTTIKHLTGKALAELSVPLPSLDEQKAITDVLGALDDKIELNRQMNATLEAMAQALFKSWFVDFDPVIDNALVAGNPIPKGTRWVERAEARRTALTNGTANRTTAAPFPAAFHLTDSLGYIPQGWELKELRQLTNKISKGTTPRKKDVSEASDDATVPFIKVRDISDGGNLKTQNLDLIPRSIHVGKLKRSILKKGDVLFSIAGTIGRVTIVPDALHDSNINQAIAFIRPNALTNSLFILEHLQGHAIQTRVHSRIVQAVQANVSLTEIGDLLIIVPPVQTLNFWRQSSLDLYLKIEALKQENETLAKLRDTLLPKLISGELRIGDAEKLAAGAGA